MASSELARPEVPNFVELSAGAAVATHHGASASTVTAAVATR